MGDLGIVPRKNEQILSNYEKMKLGHPQKELDSLKKLTRKTVGTQTIDFTRVFNLVYSFFCLIIFINIINILKRLQYLALNLVKLQLNLHKFIQYLINKKEEV